MLRRITSGISILGRPIIPVLASRSKHKETIESKMPISPVDKLVNAALGATTQLTEFLLNALSKPSSQPVAAVDSSLVQQVKPLICKVYELLSEGKIAEANQFAKDQIFSIVDIRKAIEIGNYLLRNDASFRALIETCVEKCIQQTTPHVKYDFISPDGKPVPLFRSVTINGRYGDPNYILEDGFTAALFNTRPPVTDVLVPASINSYVAEFNDAGELITKLKEDGRYDLLGVTYGAVISFTLNLHHALEQRYMEQEYRKNSKRVIYLLTLEKGYNTADAIHKGAGYIQDLKRGKLGHKGTSAQEDAVEIVAGPYVDMKQAALGYKLIDEKGNMSEFVRFPHVKPEQIADAMQYVDVQIFMQATSVEDALRLETVLIADAEKVENFGTKHLEHMKDNVALSRRIQAESRGTAVSELLLQQELGPEYEANSDCERTKKHYKYHSTAHEFKKSISSGRLFDGKHAFFHSKSADSEEHLKQRASEARKQVLGLDEEIDTQPVVQIAADVKKKGNN